MHTTRHTRAPRRQVRPRLSLFQLGLVALLAVLCILPSASLASQGDRSPEYKLCVNSCTADACRDHVDDGTVEARRLPFILRLMRWTCEDDCKYHCTHMVTNDAVNRVKHIEHEAEATVAQMVNNATITRAQGSARTRDIVNQRLAELRPVQKQMVQYHGKWVFIRFLGAQEPLSVIFSLMNLYVHYKAFFMFRSLLPDSYPLKLVYIIHTLISINAWFWSAVFHSRDKNFTERMDYFSAGAVVLSGFFFSVCRLFRVSPGSPRFTLLRRVCMGALALHILYLSIGRFDYAYNMTANVTVGLMHNLLWLLYSLRPSTFPSNAIADRSAQSRAAMRAAKPPSSLAAQNGTMTPPVPVLTSVGPPSASVKARRRIQLILALMTAAAMLELLDFAPILRLLDAHALWHLATVPITSMWYDWLADDARECVATAWWIGELQRPPHVALQAASVFEKARQWVTDKLKGRAAVLAQNIELNTLTARLNELASKAGFSGSSSSGGGGAVGSSTGVAIGSGSIMTDREREKAKELGERGLV